MLIDLDSSDISDLSNNKKHLIITMLASNIEATVISTVIVNQTKVKNPNIHNKLYTPCIGNKST